MTYMYSFTNEIFREKVDCAKKDARTVQIEKQMWPSRDRNTATSWLELVRGVIMFEIVYEIYNAFMLISKQQNTKKR